MPIYYGSEIIELTNGPINIKEIYVGRKLVYKKDAHRYHCIFRGKVKDHGDICKLHDADELKFRIFFKAGATGNTGFSSGGLWTEANIYEYHYDDTEEKFVRVFHDRKPNPTDPAAGSIDRTAMGTEPLEVILTKADLPERFEIVRADAQFTTSPVEKCSLYLDKENLMLKLIKVNADTPANASIEVVKIEQYY